MKAVTLYGAWKDKFHFIQTGNLRVGVQSATNIATTFNCVVVALFDNWLHINDEKSASITDIDTYQLRNDLSRDLRPLFGGVYPIALLPDVSPHEKAIVSNTDPYHWPRAHWVCLYLNNPTTEYFDSYGLPPVHNKNQGVYSTLWRHLDS